MKISTPQRNPSLNVVAPTGIIIILEVYFIVGMCPPLKIFIIGTGNVLALVPLTYLYIKAVLLLLQRLYYSHTYSKNSRQRLTCLCCVPVKINHYLVYCSLLFIITNNGICTIFTFLQLLKTPFPTYFYFIIA